MLVRRRPATCLALALGIGTIGGCEPPPDRAYESRSHALTSSSLWAGAPTSIAAGTATTLQSKLDSRTLDDRGLFQDFVHWGKDTATSVNFSRGKAVLPNAPGYTLVGTTTAPTRTTTNAPKFSWWDGNPAKTGSSTAGLLVKGKGKGFQITLPATPEPNERVCTLYGQVLTNTGTVSKGTVAFSLADGSAAAVSKTVSSGQAFSLDYQFGSAKATNLNVKWTLTTDGGGGGVVLYANTCSWWEDQPFLVTANPATDLDQFPRFKKGKSIQVIATEVTGGPYTKIEFFEDGAVVSTKTVTSSTVHSWSITRTPAPGLHYYQIQGTRSDGRQLISGAYRIPVWIPNVQQVGLDIPDNSLTGATVNLPISGAPTGLLVADLVFSLHVTHPRDQDLVIQGIGPDGTSTNLAVGLGGLGQDYNHTRFWDKASVSILDGVAPFDAEWGYRPQIPTNYYLGKAVNGTWKLKVVDRSITNSGSLNWAEVYVLPN